MTALDWAVLGACKDVDPDLFFDDDEEPDWRDLALCTEVDPSIFFVGEGRLNQRGEEGVRRV